VDAAKVLVEGGATIEAAALPVAAQRGSLEVMKYLIEKGANVNQTVVVCDYGERSALYFALMAGNWDCARVVIEAGAADSTAPFWIDSFLSGMSGDEKAAALEVVELMIPRGGCSASCVRVAIGGWELSGGN
jgi:hypothetical protein